MMSPKNLDKLRKSLKGETFLELREFLMMHLDNLKSIDNIQEYSKAQDQAVELKAQKKAYKKLRLILEQIITLSAESERQTKDRNDFGI